MESNVLYYQPPLSKVEILEKIKNLKLGTKEWAKHNHNILMGCKNNCVYCYARHISHRVKRKHYSEWNQIALDQSHIKPSYPKKRDSCREEEFRYDYMFPTSSDIFPNEPDLPILDYYTAEFEKVLKAGNTLLITTKPRLEVIQHLCSNFGEYRGQIGFRFTITSLNDSLLKLFESDASCFEERVSSLKYATEHGFNTSVAIEPLLDQSPLPIIYRLLPYLSHLDRNRDVGTIWVGLLRSKYIPQWARVKADIVDEVNQIRKSQQFKGVYAWYKDICRNPAVRMKETIKKLLIKNQVKVDE